MPHNKQLQRTVIRRDVRAASAPFHYALAARFTRQRAAAELRCYALVSPQRSSFIAGLPAGLRLHRV